jgi:hypothetical protein
MTHPTDGIFGIESSKNRRLFSVDVIHFQFKDLINDFSDTDLTDLSELFLDNADISVENNSVCWLALVEKLKSRYTELNESTSDGECFNFESEQGARR